MNIVSGFSSSSNSCDYDYMPMNVQSLFNSTCVLHMQLTSMAKPHTE